MPKKIFNSDLETSGAVKATSVTADTATISGGYIAASTLTDGTATLSGGVLTASTLTDGTATLSGGNLLAQNIQASNVLATSILRSNSNFLSVINSHGDSDGGSNTTPFVMSLGRPAQSSGAVQIIETNEDNGAIAGVRLAYQGDSNESLGVSNSSITTNVSAVQAVHRQDFVSPTTAYNVLTFGSTGNRVRLESADDITLVPAQEDGQVYIARDSNADGPIGLTIRKPVSGSAYLSVVEGSSTTLYGGRLAYEGDQDVNSDGIDVESLGVGTLNTVALQSVNNGTLHNVLSYKYTGEDVTLESTNGITLKTGQDSVVTIEKDTELGSPVGLTIKKPVHGSAYLSVVEGISTLYGGRLAYEGDSDGEVAESLGVGTQDTVALQALNAGIVNNVLSYTYRGQDVTLSSQNDLRLQQAPGGYLSLGNTTESNQDIRIYNIPNVTTNTGVISWNLVWKPFDNSRIYFDTDMTLFSAGHLYKSDTILPVGTAVELSDNKVQAASSSMSNVVVGIVARQEEFTEDFPVTTSLGQNHTSGFATKVIALGDTRLMDCPGFNVCNENGDIQPGDLLVTSSTPGYLMKQDDDIIRSKTVGKAMEAVTFDDNGQATGVYGFIYCG